MKLFVTGVTGFVGQRLSERLRAHPARFELAFVGPGPDVTQADAVAAALEAAAPDAVLHLAARSHAPDAWADPLRSIAVNGGGTAVLCRALADRRFMGPVLVVSSSDVYGSVGLEGQPITEDRRPAPSNPYAVSKVAAEEAGLQWWRSHGLRVMVARPFPHTGPGHPARFVLPGFARQVIRAKRGQIAEIVTGDLTLTRDFSWADDVAGAYLALLSAGEPGQIYNVCSGFGQDLSSLLERLMALAGVDLPIRVDPTRLRAGDLRRVVGSAARLAACSPGSVPVPLTDAHLSAMLQYWEEAENVPAPRSLPQS